MKIKEITAAIEAYAPLCLQESWDNSGMQVGDSEREVTGVLLCTDVREEIVDEAVERGANLVISHHPLLFRGLKKIVGNSYQERVVVKAIKNDVAIYCAHTNMDCAVGGVNYKMAQKLGMTSVEILSPESSDPPGGLGVIGDVQPQPAMAFLKMAKEAFEVHTVRYSGDTERIVTRVAMCGGAGAEFIHEAIRQGAQVFITGDMKYHDFQGNESTIILADIGHYESEHYTKEIFYDIITKKSPTFAVDFARSEKNQVKYL